MCINKFIVFLYDFKIITKDEYNEFIYGTTDEDKIELTKYGLTIGGYFGLMVPPFSVQMMPLLKTLQLLDV